MRILLALTLTLLALPAHAATYLLLSQTNNVIAAATNSAKAYTDAHNAGASPWTNISGTILPVAGQTTNTLRFTSGLSDNATNVAMLVNTVSNWTGGSLLTLENAGTRRLAVDYGGGIYAGTFNNVSDFDGILDVSLLNQHDLATGEYPNLFMRQAIYADATSTNRLLGQSMSVLSVSGSDTNNWTNFQQDLHLITITNYALAGEIEVKNDPANGSAISMTSGTFSSGLGNSWWAPDRSDTFLAIHDVQKGEVANAFATVGVVDDSSSPTNGTTASLQTRLATGAQMILSDIPGGNPYRAIANASDTSLYFLLESPGGTLFAAQPTIADGTTAYIMDTTVTHTSNYLATVSNNGTNKFTIDYAGNVSAAGTVSASLMHSTNNATVGGLVVTTNAAFGGQSGYTGFTTANLPAGVAVGYQTYCTDCLTPWGTGDRVEWDGTVWRTLRVKVLATTNIATYMLSCATNRIVQFTSKSDIAFQPIFATAASGNAFVPSVFASGGTGGAAGNGGVNAVGNFISLTGGSAAAYGRINGAFFNSLQTGDAYYCGEDVAVSATPDGTDNYMDWKGLISTTTTNYPVEGAYFLYDRYNASGVVSNATFTATWTNNWICVTAHLTSYSFVDSGLAVSTSATAPNRLDVIATPTEATFYTNGVICATINTQLPTTTLWANSVEHLKTLGSTARTLNVFNRRFHVRRGTAYSF